MHAGLIEYFVREMCQVQRNQAKHTDLLKLFSCGNLLKNTVEYLLFNVFLVKEFYRPVFFNTPTQTNYRLVF